MKLKIGTKIGIVLIVFLLEMLAFIFIFYGVFNHHEHHMHELAGEMDKMDLVKSLQLALVEVVMPANDFLIVGRHPNEPDNFKTLSAKVENLIDKLDKLEFRTPEEKELLDHIRKEYFQAKRIALQIFSISSPVGNVEAGRLMEEMDGVAADAAHDADRFHQIVHEEIEKARAGWQETKNHVKVVVLMGTLFGCILTLASYIFFRRTITSPIISLRSAAIRVGRGNFEERINIKSGDELGDLAASFNQMTEDLKEFTAAEKQRAAELEKAYRELKAAQAMLIQAEKMAALGQLSAGMAHEINNPLSAILLEAEMMLRDEDKDRDTRDTSKIIVEQSKRIESIIKRLLEFSHKREFKAEPLDVNEAVEKALSLLSYQVKPENIKIIKGLDRDIPKVSGDNNQLQEAFLNIILNAVQAMEKGGTLTIRTLIQKTTGYVVIEFKDTGAGMDDKTLKKIFNPFFTTKEKGTGLGLSICYKIIEDHKGIIEVQSKLGEGSTFSVKLPEIKEG